MNYRKHLVGPTCRSAFALVLFVTFQISPTLSNGQEFPDEVQGVEVFTYGPVHEAFAGMVTFDPQPGIVVEVAPPEPIEELPPEERPEGESLTWIPGYWAWNDDRSDYLWVSGTWRALPPGREWNAGYWSEVSQGYQWISGYWSDATEQVTLYLPPPPPTAEAGPSVPAPSVDDRWTPGSWIWHEERYVWRPGYWAQGREDWDWVPAHYVTTPRGCIFVDGYWDYPVQRRGVIYAPVHFDSAVVAQRDYHYSPATLINLAVFTEHLFLRPRYNHYYFGDYYEPRYEKLGFHSSYSSHSRGNDYDPIYARNRWEHRQDRDWNRRMQESYRHRRDNASSRPPRTWADQKKMRRARSDPEFRHHQVATSYKEFAEYSDSPTRFRKVKKDEKQQLASRNKEVQRAREQRRILETRSMSKRGEKQPGNSKPTKVARKRSPIVGKPIHKLSKASQPPAAQRARASKQDEKRLPRDRERPEKVNDRRSADKKFPGKSSSQKPKQEPKRSSASKDKKASVNAQSKQAGDERKRKRSSARSDKKTSAKPQPNKAKDQPGRSKKAAESKQKKKESKES